MEALIEPLTRLAQRKLGGDAIAGLTRLSAGATQEIWRFGVFRGDVETPVILRRAPGGTRVSETAVGLANEAKLIEAAGRVGVPVPPVLCVLEDEDGLGQEFRLMGFVEGETLGGRLAARGEALAGARPAPSAPVRRDPRPHPHPRSGRLPQPSPRLRRPNWSPSAPGLVRGLAAMAKAGP